MSLLAISHQTHNTRNEKKKKKDKKVDMTALRKQKKI